MNEILTGFICDKCGKSIGFKAPNLEIAVKKTIPHKKYDPVVECCGTLIFNKKYHLEINHAYVNKLRDAALKLIQQQRYLEAKQYYDKAIEIEPNNPGSLIMAARNLRQLKRYDDALTLLEKCLNVHPQKHFTWIEMARTYERLAEDIYRDTEFFISIPRNAFIGWTNVKYYYEMTIKCMEKASEKFPESWEILKELERFHAFIGNYGLAIEYNEKAKIRFENRKNMIEIESSDDDISFVKDI